MTESDIFVPGVCRCQKCGFRLIKSNLNAGDGTVTAAEISGERCPNCDVPMWRVSWRDEAFEMSERANEFLARAIDAERGRVDPVWSGDDISELPPTTPMPRSRAHAEMMLLVAERYLSANPVGSAASDAEGQ